jgi:hypothetical protein
MKRLRQTGGRLTESASAPPLTAERVWSELAKASFAVISYVTPAGRPRASGVFCAGVGRHLYMVTAPDSWKAREISQGDEVSLTAPIRRGGLLSLVALFHRPPSPPCQGDGASCRFSEHRVDVEEAGLIAAPGARRQLPARAVPRGNFLTHGVWCFPAGHEEPCCRAGAPAGLGVEPAASRRREQEGQ